MYDLWFNVRLNEVSCYRLNDMSRPGYPISPTYDFVARVATIGLDGIGSANAFAYSVSSPYDYTRLEE